MVLFQVYMWSNYSIKKWIVGEYSDWAKQDLKWVLMSPSPFAIDIVSMDTLHYNSRKKRNNLLVGHSIDNVQKVT